MTTIAGDREPAPNRPVLRWLSWLALLALTGLLLADLAMFARHGVRAIHFPYELDYGEGIVWQQLLLLFTDRSYGPVGSELPAIAFQYPPVYHAVTAAVAALGGCDVLAAGRFVSLASTVSIGMVAGLIAWTIVGDDAGKPVRWTAAAISALVTLAYWPVQRWAPLMRVDMIAVLFGLSGIYLGVKALGRSRLIYLAALCFVLAVYAKQIAIAAPAATFLTLLYLQPRLAVRGIIATILLGAITLAVLTFATDGGFVSHVFLYNINRFKWWRLGWIVDMLQMHALYFYVAALMAIRRVHAVKLRYAGLSGASLQRALASSFSDALYLAMGAHLGFASLMLVTVAKSGSSVNYFIEWLCVLSVFVGVAAADAFRAGQGNAKPGPLLGTVLLAALALQVHLIPSFSYARKWSPEQAVALDALSTRIAAAQKPIISDDMVLLLRSGKSVLWEPSIFAELASLGMWDERPLIARIRRGDFAFFVTVGQRGAQDFDSRYNRAVADAIDAAYPVKENQAEYTLHMPARRSVLAVPPPKQP